jgi:hypothetical protein
VVYSANIPPTGAVISESPFVRSLDVIAMMPDWSVMAAVTKGTNYIRDLSETYLPQEPREDDDAYQTRVDRSVLSPYTSRLIETAAGAILRKPIHIEGDPYWLELAKNIDGIGSNINEYARRALVSSLTYGHSAILVDYPAAANAMNLAEERAMGRRPYFVHIDAPQIWGWRKESGTNRLLQVRIHDYDVRPLNEFGEEQVEEMRVIYPGRYDLYTLGRSTETVSLDETGGYSLDEIPLVPIYSNRRDVLISQPPLLDIANLNITHYQRQADLIHALHIAAMPTLVLEGWDDTTGSATMGVNYAIAMQPGNKAYYVQADATSFDAQMQELQSLEGQMSTLGVTKLSSPSLPRPSASTKPNPTASSRSLAKNWKAASTKPSPLPPSTSASNPPRSKSTATSTTTASSAKTFPCWHNSIRWAKSATRCCWRSSAEAKSSQMTQTLKKLPDKQPKVSPPSLNC